MTRLASKTVAIIVAHPDDETLWAGGSILSHPSWKCFVVCLSRADDENRAPRFHQALNELNAEGAMGNLDDGPDLLPLADDIVENAILEILPQKHYDLVITHNPSGEYTRHIRHEETSKAVINLWHAGKISTNELWTFAYEDGAKEYYPRPIKAANIFRNLTKRIWQKKYKIITETYGFEKNSFEVETTPPAESFWVFTNPYDADSWLKNGGSFL